jgi:uncharacterized protein
MIKDFDIPPAVRISRVNCNVFSIRSGLHHDKKLYRGDFLTLEQFFHENPKAALGFSGGVDSSYVLYAGLHYGADVKAYYVKSAFQPDFELRDAKRLARQLGAKLTVLEKNILDVAHVAENSAEHCYYCKAAIFKALHEQALADGYSLIIDGNNASDDASDRPGMRAVAELAVRSPLRECGITKAQVRNLSKEAGLFTWDKPAYACLATRIPTGRIITEDLLRRVEKAEDALFSLGFTDFRVRVYGEDAKLQFPAEQMAAAVEKRETIVELIKKFFRTVLLDLESR